MKQLVSILGYIVVCGYLVKIFFQMYLRHKRGADLGLGPGNSLNIEYFKSIKDKVDPKFDLLKKLLNVIHWLVIPYLVLCFLYVLFLYVSKAPQKI